jgi:hypothetical protein
VNGGGARPFNTHMKYLAACVVLGCAGAATAAPQPQQIPQRDLRQVLQQYHPGTTTPPPRQLTPSERAELRRQLDEYRAPRRR